MPKKHVEPERKPPPPYEVDNTSYFLSPTCFISFASLMLVLRPRRNPSHNKASCTKSALLSTTWVRKITDMRQRRAKACGEGRGGWVLEQQLVQ